MGRPRLIILIRHGQSEGNKNRDIHQTVPDHRVKLTNEGWQQAYEAGNRLRAILRADDTVQFFTSPYRRTRETTEGILQTLTSDDPEPSPFKRNNIKVYEEPRLREQDFGNFQPCSAEMERMWQERADYGHFFYRIPDGESAADAYDRVSGFNESLWRQFGEDDFPSVCVLVTHGLMSRVFLMKWYHFSVEYFEDLRNVNHCEFLIMRKQADGGKYELESKLRTWSELRRERAALLKQKDEESTREASQDKGKDNNVKDKDSAKLERAVSGLSSPSSTMLVPQRRWGGCPNGCNHDKNFKIRPGLADLIKHDGTNVYETDNGNSNGNGSQRGSKTLLPAVAHVHSHNHAHSNHSTKSSTPTPPALTRRTTGGRRFQVVGYSDDDDGGELDEDNCASSPELIGTNSETGGGKNSNNNKSTANGSAGNNVGGGGGLVPPKIDVSRAREEIVSSPDATPSFITPEARQRAATPNTSPPPAPKPFMHIGRDFGGTYSGHTSDADSSEDDRVRRRMARLKMSIGSGANESTGHTHSHSHGKSGLGKSGNSELALADAAGSSSPATPSNIRRKRTKNMANRLGDAPHYSDHEHGEGDGDLGADEMDDELDMDDDLLNAGAGGDETDVDHDLTAAESEDRSLRGSVY